MKAWIQRRIQRQLIELRRLDCQLKQAMIEVLIWWSGPTKTEQSLFEILCDLRARFDPSVLIRMKHCELERAV